MANTTPDNIYYPVVGDQMNPLAGKFALLASSVQNALNAHPYNPSDLTALAALSGMSSGSLAVVQEGGAVFEYNGTAWIQITEARFATAAARDTAYAKASGAYRNTNARARLADRGYVTAYFGTAWGGVGGLVPLRPTSVNGTGVSIDTDGSIVCTGATLTEIRGFASSDFTNYRILIKGSGSSTGAAFYMRLMSGTTIETSSNYIWEGAFSNPTLGLVRWTNGGANLVDLGRLHVDATRRASFAIELYDLQLGFNTGISYVSSGVDGSGPLSISSNGAFNLPTAFDGAAFLQSAGTFTGRIQIFGYGKA